MSKTSSLRVPSYRRHKPTGQAVVTINGSDLYLGKWNTAASRTEYDRLIAEFLANDSTYESVVDAKDVRRFAYNSRSYRSRSRKRRRRSVSLGVMPRRKWKTTLRSSFTSPKIRSSRITLGKPAVQNAYQ